MEYDVHVLQIITNGPSGYPKDDVVDIGICGVDLKNMEVDSLYSMTVGYDVNEWSTEKTEHLKQTGLDMNDVMNGAPLEDVCADVKRILFGKMISSFDIRNVFYRYMVNEPWDLTKETSVMPSVSSRLPPSLRCSEPSDENKKIFESYERLFTDDPMNIGSGRKALDYSLMTSAILMELRKRGKY